MSASVMPSCPDSAQKRQRSCADQDLSVADIEKLLEQWFQNRCSRDVSQMLRALKELQTWKTAPSSKVLGQVADLFELMASIEASPGQLFRMVRLPTASPFLFTALKSSVVLALIGTIVSEAVKGFEGLGYVILRSMGRFDAPQAWLALISIAAMGIAWYLLVQAAERMLLPWEAHSRSSG